jgi:arylesterase / paraoxonase
MKIVLKAVGVVLAIVVIAVGVTLTVFVARSGMMTERGPDQVMACTAIDGQGKSGEDILIDRERSLALVSWLDRRGGVAGPPTFGTVGRIDLTATDPKIENALLADPPDFRPHGLSLFVGPEGQRTLFVISHPPGQPHRVEVFEANADGMYEHKQTIADPLLVRPNDIQAVGPRQFYIANDSGAVNGMGRMREMVFGASLAAITYYDGAKFSVAYDGTASPGGINASLDLSTIYVAETQGNRITAFARDAATGVLKPSGVADIPSLPDNIDVAADGALWVTAHANAVALVQQFADATKVAPTQVFRIPPDTLKAQQVFFNKGDMLSAGSVAATLGDKMLLGSITDKKVMLCQTPT